MNITVVGASGRTGLEVVNQALAAGDVVYAVSRHHEGFGKHPNLHPVYGDASDPDLIARVARETEVVISVIGAPANKRHAMTDSAKSYISAGNRINNKRLIIMSTFLVEADRVTGIARYMGNMMSGMIADRAASEDMIRRSDLDWTIVYATRLTNQRKGSGLHVLKDSEKIGISNKVARADVASFMLEVAKTNAYVKQSVTVSQ